MSECMKFPETVEEFMEQYKIVDTQQVYTNGTALVPIFRMKQWFEHLRQEPCDDAVSREAAVNAIKKEIDMNNEVLRSSIITYETREHISQRNEQAREDIAAIEVLPSVTPKPKTGKWNFIGDQMFECTECGTCYTQSQLPESYREEGAE